MQSINREDKLIKLSFLRILILQGQFSIVLAGALKNPDSIPSLFYNATCLGDLNGYQQIVEILDQEMPLAK